MAIRAYLLLSLESVQACGMTGGTLDIFLKPVQGVALGSGDIGNSLVTLQVTGCTLRARYDNFIVRPL